MPVSQPAFPQVAGQLSLTFSFLQRWKVLFAATHAHVRYSPLFDGNWLRLSVQLNGAAEGAFVSPMQDWSRLLQVTGQFSFTLSLEQRWRGLTLAHTHVRCFPPIDTNGLGLSAQLNGAAEGAFVSPLQA